MAYEFGFDVVRVDLEEVATDPGEPREFLLEALAGEVAARIAVGVEGLTQLVDAIGREERRLGSRPGGAWEPQLPQMRGFFFHPRVVLAGVQASAPHAADDEMVEYWELVVDDEDGSQVVMRLSEPVMRSLVRRIHHLIGDLIA